MKKTVCAKKSLEHFWQSKDWTEEVIIFNRNKKKIKENKNRLKIK